MTTKTEFLGVRIDKETLQALRDESQTQERSMSFLVTKYIREATIEKHNKGKQGDETL